MSLCDVILFHSCNKRRCVDKLEPPVVHILTTCFLSATCAAKETQPFDLQGQRLGGWCWKSCWGIGAGRAVTSHFSSDESIGSHHECGWCPENTKLWWVWCPTRLSCPTQLRTDLLWDPLSVNKMQVGLAPWFGYVRAQRSAGTVVTQVDPDIMLEYLGHLRERDGYSYVSADQVGFCTFASPN